MAWPHCGRILGRYLGNVGCNVSTARHRGCEFWKLSSATGHGFTKGDQSLHTDTRDSEKPRDCGSRGAVRGNGHGAEATVIFGYSSGTATRIAGESRAHDGCQAFRPALRSDVGIQFLHSSSIESDPSTVGARASDVTAPHFKRLETIHGAIRSAPGISAVDSLQTEDGRTLYSGMMSKELLATVMNLQLVSFEPMVDLSIKVLTSRLMRYSVTSLPILWLAKRTAYSHFCAGKDVAEAGVTVNRLWELGLKGILVYSLEDTHDEESCDRNCAGFLDSIRITRSLPDGSMSFVCVKISAICRIGLLERVSDHLRWQLKNPEYKLSWRQDGLPVLAPESPTYFTQKIPESLSSEEERDLLKAQQRLKTLCNASAEDNIPILVDAENSLIQPAIDYLTYGAAAEFNMDGMPILYATMQTYLKDAPARLSLAMSAASKRNVPLGYKLVRGAYMASENSLAVSLGAPSPIHQSIRDTHQCYDSCASLMLDHVASGNSAVVFATHNIDSGRFAAQRANDLGIDKSDPRLQFAQLKGMADSLSLALVHAGFNVSKYLPFGPVADVIPYLVRRAEENRGLLGNTLMERKQMRKELGRRLKSAVSLKQFA